MSTKNIRRTIHVVSKHFKSIEFVSKKLKSIVLLLVSKPFDRYLILTQNTRKILNIHRKYSTRLKIYVFSSTHSKNIKIIREIFAKYRIFFQNIHKVFDFGRKVWRVLNFYQTCLRCIGVLRKTFEEYHICTQHIRTVQNFDAENFKIIWPPNSKSICFWSKIL